MGGLNGIAIDPIVLLVTAIFAALALWKFLLVFRSMLSDPVKQAKRYGMTVKVVRRTDVIILLYVMLVFYEAVMAIYQQPGRDVWKIGIDISIQFLLASAIFGLFFENVAELNNNAGLGGAALVKRRHLWRILNDRGLWLVEVFAAPPLVIAKYYVQGVPEYLVRAIAV